MTSMWLNIQQSRGWDQKAAETARKATKITDIMLLIACKSSVILLNQSDYTSKTFAILNDTSKSAEKMTRKNDKTYQRRNVYLSSWAGFNRRQHWNKFGLQKPLFHECTIYEKYIKIRVPLRSTFLRCAIRRIMLRKKGWQIYWNPLDRRGKITQKKHLILSTISKGQRMPSFGITLHFYQRCSYTEYRMPVWLYREQWISDKLSDRGSETATVLLCPPYPIQIRHIPPKTTVHPLFFVAKFESEPLKSSLLGFHAYKRYSGNISM